MTNTKDVKAGPIEVWLRQRNMEITCTVVYEDESTAEMDVDSLSMRGAQREVTGWFLRNGYTAAGRWETELETLNAVPGHEAAEVVRRFKENR